MIKQYSFDLEPFDPYLAELRNQAIRRRVQSAKRIVELLGMSEQKMVRETDQDEWLIVRDFLETRSPDVSYGGALQYIEDLDYASLSMRSGIQESKGE